MALYIIKARDGSEHGPYSSGEVRESIRRGRIRGSDLIRTATSSHWRRVSEVPTLAGELETASPKSDPESGSTTPRPLDPPQSGSSSEPTLPSPVETPTTRPAVPSIDLELGFADRVLRLGFAIGRWVSVLIIGAAVLGFLGGLAVVGWTLLPRPSVEPPPDPLVLAPPSAFIAACQPAPAGQSQPNKGPAFGSAPGNRVDPCQAWRPRIQAICAHLQAPHLEDLLCDVLRREVQSGDEDAFLSGLKDTAKAWAGITPRPPACPPKQLIEWYLQMYRDAAERRMAPVLAYRQAEAVATAFRSQVLAAAMWAVMVSIGALIVFLFLPLLIQIERNTRPRSRAARSRP